MSEALSAKFVQISSQATWSKKLRTCSHQKVHHMYQFQETEAVSCHAEAVGQVEQKTVAVIGGGVFATNTAFAWNFDSSLFCSVLHPSSRAPCFLQVQLKLAHLLNVLGFCFFGWAGLSGLACAKNLSNIRFWGSTLITHSGTLWAYVPGFQWWQDQRYDADM